MLYSVIKLMFIDKIKTKLEKELREVKKEEEDNYYLKDDLSVAM